MKRAIFYLIVVFGMIFSVASACAVDLNDTQAIPSDDFVQNDEVSLDETDSGIGESYSINVYYDDQQYAMGHGKIVYGSEISCISESNDCNNAGVCPAEDVFGFKSACVPFKMLSFGTVYEADIFDGNNTPSGIFVNESWIKIYPVPEDWTPNPENHGDGDGDSVYKPDNSTVIINVNKMPIWDFSGAAVAVRHD